MPPKQPLITGRTHESPAKTETAVKNPWAGVRINRPPRFSICEPGWSWRPPPLPDHDLWFIVEGQGTVAWPDRNRPSIELRKSSALIFSPGDAPYVQQQKSARLQIFVLHFSFLNPRGRTIEHLPLPPAGTIVRDAGFFHAMARRCELYYRRGDDSGRRQSHHLLGQMLMQLWDESRHPPPTPADARLQEAMEGIHREPGRRWNIEQLADACKLSRSQLTRRFAAAAGMSPMRFVIQARLDRAARLIEETEMSLGEIADALGYESLFFFSRQFRQFHGRAPSAVRKGNREKLGSRPVHPASAF